MGNLKIFRWSFIALLVAFVFDFRYIFFDFFTSVEYARASFYTSDVPLAIFLLSGIVLVLERWTTRDLFVVTRFKWMLTALAIFFMFGTLSLIHASSLWLGLYTLLRLGSVVFMALLIAYGLRRNVLALHDICLVLVAFAVAQSLIGFLQFRAQSDLGLRYLGESVLSADMPGVAKIVYAGTAFIRAYGTFPHPNVLGAFLVIGLLAIALLWLRNTNMLRIYEMIMYTSSIFSITLGILLSFSRAAWGVLIVVIIFLFYKIIKCLLCSDRNIADISISLSFIPIVLLSVVAQVIIFWPFVAHRFQIGLGDAAVSERVTYAQIALDEMRTRPLLGVGIGNYVLYGINNGLYARYGMANSWQWQPAHNIYLLLGAEIGVGGLIVFLLFIYLLLNSNIQFLIFKQYQNLNGQNQKFVILLMFVALLLLGFFDHFLWTLEQGRLLFWIVAGILMGISGARRLTPTPYTAGSEPRLQRRGG